MSQITTHVLDTSLGKPASDLHVALEIHSGKHEWIRLAEGRTQTDGRLPNLLPTDSLKAGLYRMTFDTASYFQANGLQGFYPYILVAFEIQDTTQHYHVPLLLSPYGYSTYRGS